MNPKLEEIADNLSKLLVMKDVTDKERLEFVKKKKSVKDSVMGVV